MAGITEVEPASLEIDESKEHRHEHATLVVLRQCIVHTGSNLCRHHLLGSKGTEETRSLSHEQRGRNTLTRNVANTEIEVITYQQIAIKITSHLLGRCHRCIEIEPFTVG